MEEQITEEYLQTLLKRLLDNSNPKSEQSIALETFYMSLIIYLNELCQEIVGDVNKVNIKINQDQDIHIFKVLEIVIKKLNIKYLRYGKIFEISKETTITLKALQYYLQVIANGKKLIKEVSAATLEKSRENEKLKNYLKQLKEEITQNHQAKGKALEKAAKDIDELKNVQMRQEKLHANKNLFEIEVAKEREKLDALVTRNKCLDLMIDTKSKERNELRNRIVDEKVIESKLSIKKNLVRNIQENNEILTKLEADDESKIELSSKYQLLNQKLEAFRCNFKWFYTLSNLENEIVKCEKYTAEYFKSRIQKCEDTLSKYHNDKLKLEEEYKTKEALFIKQIDALKKMLQEMAVKENQCTNKLNQYDESISFLEEQCCQIKENTLLCSKYVAEAYENILSTVAIFNEHFMNN